MLSLIIPTFNAADTLAAALASVGTPDQIIIADGGSTDDTRAIAAQKGATFLETPKGRGSQLAKGAKAATSPWLLFLHADTQLTAGWQDEVQKFSTEPNNLHRAAVFKFALKETNPAARRLEKIVAWRSRSLGLPYGDQGLLISRAFYDHIGGFKELPLFEDVDIIRRIGRSHLNFLETAAVTSARRYQKNGYILRPLRNLTCLALYFAGLPPKLIERIYQ